MKKFRLRYAPSPTGFLHIGNTRTALMNYLFAKHYNGDFIVRIEDTDIERNVEGAIESQFDNLNWLGLTPDESFLTPKPEYGAYIQSKKLDRYLELANQLVEEGKAYRCYCTAEELEVERERQISQGIVATQYSGKCATITDFAPYEGKDFSIRFKVPKDRVFQIKDIVRDLVEFHSKEIGDFVIIKTNKIATYNFAVVVDDFDMQITHVVRGEEHISNTPRQCMIYEAFGWDQPTFCHLTLIVDETKKKLSKRSGNAVFFISQYREKGFLPEAVFNYIVLLGWSPKEEKEIFTREEFVKIFDESRFSKSPSTFDMVKMKWINSQWMKKLTDEDYLAFTKNFVDTTRFTLADKSEAWLNAVLLLFKKEIEFGSQINEHLDIFFNDIILEDETKALFGEFSDAPKLVEALQTKLKNLTVFEEAEIKDCIKALETEFNVKGKNLFMPIRIATTLVSHGPELAKTIALIGKERVLQNIAKVI